MTDKLREAAQALLDDRAIENTVQVSYERILALRAALAAQVQEEDMVSRENLQSMTVKELAKFIWDNEW